jgi:hypothetical protein
MMLFSLAHLLCMRIWTEQLSCPFRATTSNEGGGHPCTEPDHRNFVSFLVFVVLLFIFWEMSSATYTQLHFCIVAQIEFILQSSATPRFGEKSPFRSFFHASASRTRVKPLGLRRCLKWRRDHRHPLIHFCSQICISCLFFVIIELHIVIFGFSSAKPIFCLLSRSLPCACTCRVFSFSTFMRLCHFSVLRTHVWLLFEVIEMVELIYLFFAVLVRSDPFKCSSAKLRFEFLGSILFFSAMRLERES